MITSNITLTEWLALIGVAMALIAGSWRVAFIGSRIEHRLSEIDKRFEKIECKLESMSEKLNELWFWYKRTIEVHRSNDKSQKIDN